MNKPFLEYFYPKVQTKNYNKFQNFKILFPKKKNKSSPTYSQI